MASVSAGLQPRHRLSPDPRRHVSAVHPRRRAPHHGRHAPGGGEELSADHERGRRLALGAVLGPGPQRPRPGLVAGRIVAGVRPRALLSDGAGFGPADLAVLDVKSGALRVLTDGKENVGFPSWSPDGRRIVYREWNDTSSSLRIIDVESRAVTTLLRDFGRVNFPGGRRMAAWSSSPAIATATTSSTPSRWNRSALRAQARPGTTRTPPGPPTGSGLRSRACAAASRTKRHSTPETRRPRAICK